MDLQLRGKRALVTGATAGIGEGIAKALAREGALVVVHGRNQKEAHRVVQQIESDGGKAAIALGDLASDAGAKSVAGKALAAFAGVEILVNNAGTYALRDWESATPDLWSEIYDTNVVSMVRMVQLLLPQMKKLGWGRMIQIASTAAATPPAVIPDYSATKAANVAMTVSLAKSLANTGITANAVSPGPIITANWNQFARQIGAAQGWGSDVEVIKTKLLQSVFANPSGRLGEVEDVANLVAFLASPLAGFINGANFRVDGGLTPGIN